MTFLYPNVQINHRVIFFLLMLMVAPAVGAGQQIELSCSKSGISRDGHVRLQWAVTDGSSGNVFLVQQAETEAFSTPRIIYHGPDQATFRAEERCEGKECVRKFKSRLSPVP